MNETCFITESEFGTSGDILNRSSTIIVAIERLRRESSLDNVIAANSEKAIVYGL